MYEKQDKSVIININTSKGEKIMKEFIRIMSITIEGIKNVCHGSIKINNINEIESEEFLERGSILGIYGQNGSGKSTVLEATDILKTVIEGKALPDYIGSMINTKSQKARLEYSFYVDCEKFKGIVDYSFEIVLSEEDKYVIDYEKLSLKKFEDGKWRIKRTLFEAKSGEITYTKVKRMISKDTHMFSKLVYEIKPDESLIFGDSYKDKVSIEIAKKKESELLWVVKVLKYFSMKDLVIIKNNVMGSIYLDKFVSLNVYLQDSNTLKRGNIAINLFEPNILPVNIFDDVKSVVKQISIIIKSLVPSLEIGIANKKEQLMEDGSNGISFEIVSVRDEKNIPLVYESEGIKRIISITSALVAVYNKKSVCLMVDELDSGIHEYLLGELLKIFSDSAKGQFIFTSHNLRPLERLSYKNIIFTTVNPDNRYIYLSGVSANNNIRDFYYSAILLGGQEEYVYNETRDYRIEKAFRKAGKLYGSEEN